MAQRYDVYKCTTCDQIIEVLRGGAGSLVCCGKDMDFQKEGSVDAAKEKHVPVIEKTAAGFKVKVGSVPHPMQAEHWIEWVELIADGVSYTRFLNPGEAPEAEFCISASKVTAREYCNLHGHWKTDF